MRDSMAHGVQALLQTSDVALNALVCLGCVLSTIRTQHGLSRKIISWFNTFVHLFLMIYKITDLWPIWSVIHLLRIPILTPFFMKNFFFTVSFTLFHFFDESKTRLCYLRFTNVSRFGPFLFIVNSLNSWRFWQFFSNKSINQYFGSKLELNKILTWNHGIAP